MPLPHSEPLQPGDRLPYLLLPSAPDGAVHEFRAPRGRASVLLLLHSCDCSLCQTQVEQLLASHQELKEWDAQIVLVVADSLEAGTQWQKQLWEQAGVRVLVLTDATQRVAARCGLETPCLLIADQWGVLFFVQQAGPEHQLSTAADVVDWARFVAIQCPECRAEAL